MMGRKQSSLVAAAAAAVVLFVVVPVAGATVSRGSRMWRSGVHNGNTRMQRGLKDDIFKRDKKQKGKDDSDDEAFVGDSDCFNVNNFFRTCTTMQRRRRGRRLTRLLKKDKSEDDDDDESKDDKGKGGKGKDDEDQDTDTTSNVPQAQAGFNLEIADFDLTLGASINTQLNDGCNCREEVEQVILEYLDDVYSNSFYNFLCVAIISTSTSNVAATETGVTITVTFEVENNFEANFESTSPNCSLEDLVLCCLADAIPGSTNMQENCANCNLGSCQPTSSNVDLQTFLTNELNENQCNSNVPIVFNPVMSDTPFNTPTAEPTVTVTLNPTTAPTVAATSNPTAAPTAAATLNPTVAPTAAPSFNPTNAPVASTSDTAAPTPGLPATTTQAPTMLPTFTNTVAGTMSLSVSL